MMPAAGAVINLMQSPSKPTSCRSWERSRGKAQQRISRCLTPKIKKWRVAVKKELGQNYSSCVRMCQQKRTLLKGWRNGLMSCISRDIYGHNQIVPAYLTSMTMRVSFQLMNAHSIRQKIPCLHAFGFAFTSKYAVVPFLFCLNGQITQWWRHFATSNK